MGIKEQIAGMPRNATVAELFQLF